MWLTYFVPIIVVLGITFIHFLGEKLSEHLHKWHFHLESFGAGLMVGIIFLELLPHIATGQEHLDEYIYLPFLFGFTIIAIVEKVIYRQFMKKVNNINTNDTEIGMEREKIDEIKLKEIEVITEENSRVECSFIEQNALFEGIAVIAHGVVIGLLITLIFETYQILALIVMIPLFIRAFTLSFSVTQFLEEIKGKKAKTIKIISLFAPLFGTLIGFLFLLNKIVLYVFFAITIGLILYIVVRDMIPLGKRGKPLHFLFGVVLSVGIFVIFNLFVDI